MISIALLFALGALIFFSTGDTLSKKISEAYGNYIAGLTICSIGVIPLGITFLLFPPASITWTMVLITFAAGVSLAVGFLLVYRSLETEQASNTWALINLPNAIVVLYAVFVLQEHINSTESVAIAAIFLGALLVTVTHEMKFNKKLLPAIAGNVSWGAFFILLAYGITTSPGSWSAFFFLARIFAVLATLIYVAFNLKKLKAGIKKARSSKSMTPWKYGIASGIADGIGQSSFSAAVFLQFVAVGGAIISIEPIVVVLFGYLLYKERITRLQFAGVLITVIGAIALSVL